MLCTATNMPVSCNSRKANDSENEWGERIKFSNAYCCNTTLRNHALRSELLLTRINCRKFSLKRLIKYLEVMQNNAFFNVMLCSAVELTL